jgi:tRNA dimethylallyltransferase
MTQASSLKNAPLLAIVGPTASGKSALALALAQQFDGEIVCADSWTVRRELDIGTAKPSAAERTLVPHHLIDIVSPAEDFTAAVFKRLANRVIDDIASRGKLPILVGGTGLYVDGVLYNFSFLPAGDRAARQALNDLTIDELLERIAAAGIALGDVDVRNKRRLIRLLETAGAQPTQQALRPRTLILGLEIDRETLRERIAARVDTMLAHGLENEVRSLAERYGWDCEGLKGVGYAQWRDYFVGTQSREETRQKIIKATLDLAKRQNTWFKRNKSIHRLTTPVDWPAVVELITDTLHK